MIWFGQLCRVGERSRYNPSLPYTPVDDDRHNTAGRHDFPLLVRPFIVARGTGSRSSAVGANSPRGGRRGRSLDGAAGSTDWGRDDYRFHGSRHTPFSEGPTS